MNRPKTLKEAYDEKRRREYNEYLYSNLNPNEQEHYTIIDGLEGPIKLKSGKIVYYDPSEGQYYDRDADMYVPANEIQMHSEAIDNYSDMLKGIVEKIKNQPVPEAIMTLGEFAQDVKRLGYENAKRDFGCNNPGY